MASMERQNHLLLQRPIRVENKLAMMKFLPKSNQKYQQGQTLVETMVAVLVLTMGIGAAVALAIYGIGATNGVTKQLIAVGLAREGIEAVKNMRDTNWLHGSLNNDCFNFYTQTTGGYCYRDWLNAPRGYTIDSGTYVLGFDETAEEGAFWQLIPESRGFGLDYINKEPAYGLYRPTQNSVSLSSSGFGRQITITQDNGFEPFNQDTGPRLKVTVDVWWSDKRCPVSDSPPASESCKITLETYLTNWKDY